MTAGYFPPCHRQTSSTYTRYAVVGLPSAGQKISPPWRDLFRPTIVRPGTPPINVRRGRRPAVERSGTNALGVRRPFPVIASQRSRWRGASSPDKKEIPFGISFLRSQDFFLLTYTIPVRDSAALTAYIPTPASMVLGEPVLPSSFAVVAEL